MLVVLTQIPTIICIIFMGMQAKRLLRASEFYLINIAWIINIVYLCANFFLEKFHYDKLSIEITSVILDIPSIFCFYLAVRKSKKVTQLDFHQINIYIVLALMIFSGFLSILFKPIYSFNPLKLPFAIVNFYVLFLFANLFKTYSGKSFNSKFLYFSIILYSLLQFLIIFPDKITYSEYMLFDTMQIGFSGGLICKVLILISMSILILESVKEITEKEKDLDFSEQLQKILGLTFHEVMPPLDETKIILSDFFGDEASDYISTKGEKKLKDLENSIERISTIITASLRLYQTDVLNFNPGDEYTIIIPVETETDIHNLNTLIQIAVLNFKNNYLKKYINNNGVGSVSFTIESGAHCNIKCNSVEIVQVVYNLIKNSFEAVTENDIDAPLEIFIKTKNITKEEFSINKKFIQMEVEDDGPGISHEIIDKIFEEGFSTKKSTKRGRGFGLHIVKSNIESNGGTVQIESPVINHHNANNKNPGTKFTFLFERENLKLDLLKSNLKK